MQARSLPLPLFTGPPPPPLCPCRSLVPWVHYIPFTVDNILDTMKEMLVG